MVFDFSKSFLQFVITRPIGLTLAGLSYLKGRLSFKSKVNPDNITVKRYL